jgi:hypothetical protein
LSCEYLREFYKKFETVLMEYSGAGGKLIHEKNQKQKSRDTVPLSIFYLLYKNSKNFGFYRMLSTCRKTFTACSARLDNFYCMLSMHGHFLHMLSMSKEIIRILVTSRCSPKAIVNRHGQKQHKSYCRQTKPSLKV